MGRNLIMTSFRKFSNETYQETYISEKITCGMLDMNAIVELVPHAHRPRQSLTREASRAKTTR